MGSLLDVAGSGSPGVSGCDTSRSEGFSLSRSPPPDRLTPASSFAGRSGSMIDATTLPISPLVTGQSSEAGFANTCPGSPALGERCS